MFYLIIKFWVLDFWKILFMYMSKVLIIRMFLKRVEVKFDFLNLNFILVIGEKFLRELFLMCFL